MLSVHRAAAGAPAVCYPRSGLSPEARFKSNAEATLREVCRSRPAFGKQLLFATILFTGLLCADLYLLGRLTLQDLSRQVIDQAFAASLDTLRPRPAPAQPLLPRDVVLPPAPDVECPVGDPVSTERIAYGGRGPVETAGGLFRSVSMRVERAVTDLRGNVLWRDFWQGSLFDRHDGRERHLEPDHDWVREVWMVDGKPRPVVAVRQSPTPGNAREIAIPEDLIDQELAHLQGDLQRKVVIGACAAVLILVIAFLYVLRLLRRTRLLEAQAQMDDRLAYVGGLAAGLAHEIRNPLNVLSMNLQMLEEDVAARLGPEGGDTRQYLKTLQGEIRRLGSLVDNFLSYARPAQPRFASADLNSVIATTCLLVRPQFEALQITLREDLAHFLPAVDLDEAQIRQALMNILMNAAQILKPGGTVAVQSAVVPDGGVQVSVTDDGPGIPKENRQKIFDVFYSTRPGGTGLGLAIAARILEAHGGRITVEGGPGERGARFVLRLPRRHPAEPAAAPGAVAVAGKS
jgi:signal transduction histidine kinase